MRLRLLPAFVLGAVLIGVALTAKVAQAADLSKFKPGNIIDDKTFYSPDSMSSAQVQSFLNSKVPTCDTNGLKAYTGSGAATDYNHDGTIQRWERGKYAGNPAPFVCLKDYSQQTPATNAVSGLCGNITAKTSRTAAQIIKDVSDACGVSPKVLIVLLQKEQNLVIDDWPWTSQYTKATGFACPDTNPCDPAFKGFFYQVYNAAYQFKRYRADPTNWNYVPHQTNTIYYHPGPYDSAHHKYYGSAGSPAGSKPDITYCGSKSVYLENQATAGLYNYTPYVPNAAALSAGYGTGNTCSSYGNRNFYNFFTDWFGSTHSDSDHEFILCDGEKYLSEANGSRKRAISASTQIIWKLDDSLFTENDYACSLPNYDMDLGNLVRSRNTGKLYLIDNGNAYLVQNQDQATAWGLGSMSQTVPLVEPGVITENLVMNSSLPRLATSTNETRSDIYLIEAGKRHLISGTEVGDEYSLQLVKGYDAIPTATMSVDLLQTLTASTQVDYSFYIGSDLYLLDHNTVRKVPSAQKALWETVASGAPTFSSDALTLFDKTLTINSGFYRDGHYYKLQSGAILDQTDSSAVAKNWEPAGSPTITRLLTNKILGDTASGNTYQSLPADNHVRLIECNNKQYIIERGIRVKRQMSAYAVSAWNFTNYYFYAHDSGCNYPAYGVTMDNALRSRNTGKLYYIEDGNAYYIKNQAAGDTKSLGDIHASTFPNFEPSSILDNFTTHQDLPD